MRRSERLRRLEAALLVAPLFLFLLVFFVVPILGLLLTRVDNAEQHRSCRAPRKRSVWAGEGLPTMRSSTRWRADFTSSPRPGRVASAAKRLNYDIPGFRGLMLSTARKLPEAPAGGCATRRLSSRPAWGEPSTWAAIKRAARRGHRFYLLAAIDLQRDDQGSIVAAPPEAAVYRAVLVRTFAISLSVTLICLLLGYPLAYLIATAPSRTANILLLFVLLPFWTSLLVRTTAWVVLLQTNGVVNSVLAWLGVTGPEGLTLIYNRVGVSSP